MDEIKRLKEMEKVNPKRWTAYMIIIGIIALLFLALVLALIGLAKFVVNEWREGQSYSPAAWQETIDADEYADKFPAEQIAPRHADDIDGNAIEAWYWCYEIVGAYSSPPVQQWIEERGQEPIIWPAGDDVPAVYPFGTFDLTGKQLHPFLVDGEMVIVGFSCPINATVGQQ